MVPYRDLTGTITKFEIDNEVETDQSEPLNAWASKKRGRPYPNGTEFSESERRDAEGNLLQKGAQPRHPSSTSTTIGGGSIRIVHAQNPTTLDKEKTIINPEDEWTSFLQYLIRSDTPGPSTIYPTNAIGQTSVPLPSDNTTSGFL